MDRASLEQTLHDLAGRSDLKLPPYPAVLARISRLLAKDDYTIAELAGTVRADQAVTAAVLRFANSARFNTGTPIASLDRAVKLVGARELMRCVIATSLGMAATSAGPLMSLRYKIWREALLSAMLAQELAPGRRVAPDAAYLAGLLHDFGKIVLLGALEAAVIAPPALEADEWSDLVERLHVPVGLRAAREWKLPPDVVEVMRCHHGEATREEAHRPMIGLIQHIDEIVELAERSPTISAGLLGAVPGLTPREQARVVDSFPALVDAVASFADPAPEPRNPPVSWVAPTRSVPPSAAPVHFVVRCQRHGAPLQFAARNVDWHALRVTGQHPLAENGLVKVALELPDRDISVWMTVASCIADGGAYAIELRPFALHGEIKSAYYEMVMRSVRSSRTLPAVPARP